MTRSSCVLMVKVQLTTLLFVDDQFKMASRGATRRLRHVRVPEVADGYIRRLERATELFRDQDQGRVE